MDSIPGNSGNLSVGGSNNPAIMAQFVMPWFMGAAWFLKFDGNRAKFGEWRVQVEAMLRAQGLSEQQQADFLLGALEGDAKRELHLVQPSSKNTGAKVLQQLQTLYAKPTTKAQLRASFFNCRQCADETVSAYILRLRELFSRWQERDAGGTEDGEDLLLDQLMVGLCAGPIKQELSRQLRRDERLTFSTACKEARALEQELQEGEEVAISQRVTAPPPRNDRSHLEQLKSQLREELQQDLMGEM